MFLKILRRRQSSSSDTTKETEKAHLLSVIDQLPVTILTLHRKATLGCLT
jgi:hypothetical protein